MRIVYTFISDSETVPEYTKYSLKKARELNPQSQIDFICKHHQSMFNDYDINWVPQEPLSNGRILKSFNEICQFDRHGQPNTTYPSTHDFWHRTAERIFYLQEHASRNKLTNFFHLENDVVMFHPVAHSILDSEDKSQICVVRMSQTHTTFAYCHIPNYVELEKLCNFFIEILFHVGEDNLRIHGGYDHISEMSLLNMALRNKVVGTFPILPSCAKRFVFDPGSYGQYLGGTNNGHGTGFTDPTHYIGSYINSTKNAPRIENGLPMMENKQIFNLHIHSKNLKDFVI